MYPWGDHGKIAIRCLMFSCVGFCPRCCEGRCVTGLLLSRSSPQCVVLARDGCSVHVDKHLHIPNHPHHQDPQDHQLHIYHIYISHLPTHRSPSAYLTDTMRFARQTRCSYLGSLVTPSTSSLNSRFVHQSVT